VNTTNFVPIIALFLMGSFTIAAAHFLQLENNVLFIAWASSSSSLPNTENIETEGNSTFTNSTQGIDQDLPKVFVIPNPNPNPVPLATSNGSPAINNNQLTSNETKSNLQNNESSLESQEEIKNQQSAKSNSSSQNEMQRGEYKVDNNGLHYYNINNCSLVKGSSGIGDLSECEDAEREMQEELTG
jgi:hypothetical protein